MKQSPLAAGLNKAAVASKTPAAAAKPSTTTASKTVLIGAHFAPEVRRTLLLVPAERENSGKNLKQLLGEAINDLCAKYGKPEPYAPDDV
jgi:hypothetical protein